MFLDELTFFQFASTILMFEDQLTHHQKAHVAFNSLISILLLLSFGGAFSV